MTDANELAPPVAARLNASVAEVGEAVVILVMVDAFGSVVTCMGAEEGELPMRSIGVLADVYAYKLATTVIEYCVNGDSPVRATEVATVEVV